MQKHEKKQKLKTIAWRKKYEINQVDDIEKQLDNLINIILYILIY